MYIHTYIYYIHTYTYMYTKHLTKDTDKPYNAGYLKYCDMEFEVLCQPSRKNKVSLC
jgi:hypothetical protein